MDSRRIDDQEGDRLANDVDAGLDAFFAGDTPEFNARLGLPADGGLQPITTPGVDELPAGTRLGGYEILRILGHGGMGVVYEARQHSPDRSVALKVIRPDALTNPYRRRAFQREVENLARVDHPGVARILEAHLDDETPFFTMELVVGKTFDQHIQDEQPSLAEKLRLFRQVVDGVRHAHALGVIHRDLKPVNLIVDGSGEVKILDFGLARLLDDEVTLTTLRVEEQNPVGTLAYMSPEQAECSLDKIGTHSDAYALGTILYQLITGLPPIDLGGLSWSEKIVAIRERVPARPRDLLPELDPDLEAIAMKALAKDPDQRYENAGALLADLDAFQERRPITARRITIPYLLKLHVQRNRRAVTTLAATAILLFVGGLWALSEIQGERALANASDQRYESEKAEKERLLGLADLLALTRLREDANSLWPAYPEAIPGIERWLENARQIQERCDLHKQTLGKLRAQARIRQDDTWKELQAVQGLLDKYQITQEALKGKFAAFAQSYMEQLESRANALRSELEWVFDEPRNQWWHDELVEVAELHEKLVAEFTDDDSPTSMAARLTFARTIEKRSLIDAKPRWDEAIAAIRDTNRFPLYDGLQIRPQIGLVPIGPDPASGLWEFAHLQTGKPPTRGEDGQYAATGAMGLIMVLIPGGEFWQGAQNVSPTLKNYDPKVRGVETAPIHQKRVSPFFLSKYEMTLGQWRRGVGPDPLGYRIVSTADDLGETLFLQEFDENSFPVTSVSWTEAQRVVSHLGLILPTEAQWEYACRAGTESPWWIGGRLADASTAGNTLDRWTVEHGWVDHSDFDLDQLAARDGFQNEAPVGSYLANAFGLHDTIGNVSEFCLDYYTAYNPYSAGLLPNQITSGDQPVEAPAAMRNGPTSRGGNFLTPARTAGSAARDEHPPTIRFRVIGIRPARHIDE